MNTNTNESNLKDENVYYNKLNGKTELKYQISKKR